MSTHEHAWHAAEAGAVIDGMRDRPGALLPILHALQERFGYVDPEAVPLIAQALNLSRADVHGVISFYHHFRQAPPGQHVVRICRGEACQAMGANALAAHAKRRLGIGFGETTANGKVTLEEVFCLGNCACGPSVLVDEDGLKGRVGEGTLDEVLADLGEGRP